jgi:hypothetical protein
MAGAHGGGLMGMAGGFVGGLINPNAGHRLRNQREVAQWEPVAKEEINRIHRGNQQIEDQQRMDTGYFNNQETVHRIASADEDRTNRQADRVTTNTRNEANDRESRAEHHMQTIRELGGTVNPDIVKNTSQAPFAGQSFSPPHSRDPEPERQMIGGVLYQKNPTSKQWELAPGAPATRSESVGEGIAKKREARIESDKTKATATDFEQSKTKANDYQNTVVAQLERKARGLQHARETKQPTYNTSDGKTIVVDDNSVAEAIAEYKDAVTQRDRLLQEARRRGQLIPGWQDDATPENPLGWGGSIPTGEAQPEAATATGKRRVNGRPSGAAVPGVDQPKRTGFLPK